ncbi:MAG: UDP-N-acetylmuramoyl-L-alanine--D-glutamate ligase [Oscillospiraceae bacterium]|nr:UDP-N-acetylmuramoyl-L-alanine--D-glutamate ligase [Oscillospiraceae bacterium]
MTITDFYREMKGKTVAFCGLGGSNLPLIDRFLAAGAKVTARDRRTREKLGDLADQLEKKSVQLVLGENYLEDLNEEVIFRTPGMPYHLPQLDAARARGSVVTSEMEVFLEYCPCRVFGVTGSDGKTTTTTILCKILQHAGKTVHVGGNIGKALLPDIDSIRPTDVVVAELSSFQLISVGRSPQVAVVTNMSPNHLDIHKDMQEYIDAKKNIFLHQDGFGRAVFNLDNPITTGFVSQARGECLTFSRKQRVRNGCFVNPDGTIVFAKNGVETPIMNCSEIRIPGAHNVENYLAAICAVWGYASPEDIRAVAEEFSGVEHRAELVRELDGVRWYNDSIATTPSRTVRGMLSLFSQKLILIAGGYDKKIPFEPMGEPVCEHVKTLVLMGVTAPKIEAAVKEAKNYRPGAPKILHAASLEEAVNLCRQEAKSGDIVALSPACASFDMFPNFETRGDRFRELVKQL